MHNPKETHCPKCDVELIHTLEESLCPLCEDDDVALPQDSYDYDPDGDGFPGVN